MFRNPSALAWMIPGLALAAGFGVYLERRRKRMSQAFGPAPVVLRLMPPETARRRRWKLGLRLAGVALVFLALAGPQWGVELASTMGPSRQLFVAVDVSLSMAAQDVKPTRLDKAKNELAFLLDQLKGSRVGVIAFAGEGAVMCPLTTDIEAAKLVLAELKPDAIPVPGTAIGKAIRLATSRLEIYEGTKALVILSDGEDHKTDPLGAAQAAAAAGIRIFSIGVGTLEGEPIPLKDPGTGAVEGYKKDRKGNTVVSRLGEATLREAARIASGAYFRASPGESEAVEIARLLNGEEAGPGRAGKAQQYKNRFMAPLALAFLLFLLELALPERRLGSPKRAASAARRMAAASALLILGLSGRARGATAEGSLRQGNKRYDERQYVEALKKYAEAGRKKPKDVRPPFNAGDALYRLEQYDQAAQAFSALTDPRLPPELRADAHYNLGNIFFQKQDFGQAVARYRQALTLRPADQDIRHNLALALRMTRQPPPKKNQQQPKPQPQNPDKPDPRQQNQEHDKKSGGHSPQPAPRVRDQISQEDAERILRAGAEKEKMQSQQVQKRPVQKKQPQVEEDW